jgi:hypothetical protein
LVSSLVLLEGIATLGCYGLGVIVGLFALYKSSKTKAKILFYTGILILMLSHVYVGIIIDFIFLILINRNMPNVYGIYNILTYIWIGPIVVLGMYVILELVIPEKKWYILPAYIGLSALYSVFLLLNPITQFTVSYTEPDGGLIHSSISFGTPIFIILSIIFISAIFLFGVGFLVMGLRTTGIIQKKFLILAFAFILFLSLAALDVLTSPGLFVIILRGAEMSCSIIFYLGIKEEEVDDTKISIKKEGNLERPDIALVDILTAPKLVEITEDEKRFSQENKICLVCKSHVKDVHFILCPNCGAFYCEKCATVLSDLENACWVCNGPIDKSKPVKLMKKDVLDEDDVIVGISEGDNKKNQRSKKNKTKLHSFKYF